MRLEGIETVHIRAEEAGKSKKFREHFHIATARAVANLPVLSEYCVPLVKRDGLFVAMKGAFAKDELALSGNAFKILGCAEPTIIFENLREDEQRAFIVAKKISQTPPKYPRKPADISKQPL